MEDKPIRINVMLSPGIWREIRKRGIDSNRSGSAVLRDLVSEALRGSDNPTTTRRRSKRQEPAQTA